MPFSPKFWRKFDMQNKQIDSDLMKYYQVYPKINSSFVEPKNSLNNTLFFRSLKLKGSNVFVVVMDRILIKILS